MRKGETVAKFAARNKVSVAELRAANDLKPNARLRTGSLLVVPYKVSTKAPRVAELAEAADAPAFPDPARGEIRALPTPSAAVVDLASLGQDLPVVQAAPRAAAPMPKRGEIPGDGFAGESTAAPADRKPTAKAAPARRSRTYTVRRGDTLYRIATRYGVSLQELRRANRIGKSGAIQPGQRLTVPTTTGR